MATKVFRGTWNGDLSDADNYLGGVAFAAGDTLIIENSARRLMPKDYSADTLAVVRVEDTFSGDGGEGDLYVILAATSVIYRGQGSAFRLDLTNVLSTCRVEKTGTSADALPPLMLKANLNTTDFYIVGGSVGFGVVHPSEAPVFDRLYVGAEGSILSPTVVVGFGATLNNIFMHSGTGYLNGNCEDIDLYDGTLELNTSDALDTVNVRGGILNADRHGTITELNMRGGLTDHSRTEHTRVVSSPSIEAGATYRTGLNVTFTNKLAISGRLQIVGTER